MGKAERLVEEMRPREEVSLPRQCRRHLGKRSCTESDPLSVVKRRALQRQPSLRRLRLQTMVAMPSAGCISTTKASRSFSVRQDWHISVFDAESRRTTVVLRLSLEDLFSMTFMLSIETRLTPSFECPYGLDAPNVVALLAPRVDCM